MRPRIWSAALSPASIWCTVHGLGSCAKVCIWGLGLRVVCGVFNFVPAKKKEAHTIQTTQMLVSATKSGPQKTLVYSRGGALKLHDGGLCRSFRMNLRQHTLQNPPCNAGGLGAIGQEHRERPAACMESKSKNGYGLESKTFAYRPRMGTGASKPNPVQEWMLHRVVG